MIGRLVIRADADGVMGTGHVMRCLALAEEWRDRGGEVCFLGHISSGYLQERIQGEGCLLHRMAAIHPDPVDLVEVTTWLEEKRQEGGWLVLDGYQFDTKYHDAMRATGWSLLVIDDYAHLPEYYADILFNPNAYAGEMRYQVNPDAQQLLGPRFTPLRREFCEAGCQVREIADRGRHILVTMGGSDPDNVSGKVLDALLALRRPELEVKIIVGPLNRYRDNLAVQAAKAHFAVELIQPVANIVPLMEWADLAISAAGSTCWELAALGVPMLVTVLADNQERLAASLTDHGVATNLGWFYDWQPEQAVAITGDLLENPRRRENMSRLGRQLVDGRGAGRVVQYMLDSDAVITLRRVTEQDSFFLYQLVNDPNVRSASFDSQLIDQQEHQRWFAAKIADPNYVGFIAEQQGEAIGQIRFEISGQEAEIDVSIHKVMRGKGYGAKIVRQAVLSFLRSRKMETVHAYVKCDNSTSIRTFAKAGFDCTGVVLWRGFNVKHFTMKWHRGV